MQVISFISAKGGVGKTTLAANVAIALAQEGQRVLLIDLDMQNALRLHLGMDPRDISGIVREGITAKLIYRSPFGVKFIPFGTALKSELEEFEAMLKQHPGWVLEQLFSLDQRAFDFVILDTPPGPSAFLQQALLASQWALGVVLADAASFATIARLQTLVQEYTSERSDFYGLHLLVNQVSQNNELATQVCTELQRSYQRQLCPITIGRAAAVSEALAFERPLLQYDGACDASRDIVRLARWLITHCAAALVRPHQTPRSSR